MKRVIKFREEPDNINDSTDMFKKIKSIEIDYGQENMIIFFLNSRNSLIDYEIMFKGGLNATIIDPRIIFRRAIEHNSNSIIVAHNHPSGICKPSTEDRSIFKRLKKAGDLINCYVLDSIIFTESSFYSMGGESEKNGI